tara:strand:- start:111102 stop:112394 length:1293 start_codon:yes stop_codon:yes gene_type:complete
VKNRKAIYLLFLANIISGMAQGISMLAIPWYFAEVSRTDFFWNFYLIITFITLFWGIYAGTLIDRYSRKKLFIIINCVCGLLIGSIAFIGSGSNLEINSSDILVVLVFAITIFNYNVHYPNLYAFGQEITEPKYYGKLNSYIEVQGQVTSVLAGAFAAILLTGTENQILQIGGIAFNLPFEIQKWSIYDIFLLDATTYLFVILIFSFIKYTPISKEKKHTDGIINRLKGGFLFLKREPIIFVFGLASYMLFAFTIVEIHVLLPDYVKNFLIAEGNVFASAEIYYSFGAIFSGLLILRLFKKVRTVFAVIILMSIASLSYYYLVFVDFLWYFFLANFLIGITNAGVRILRTTYIFNHVPNNLIGRANSVFGTLNIVVRMLLIGILSFSFFQISDNIRYGFFVGLCLMLLSIGVLFLWSKKIVSSEEKTQFN